MQIMRNTLIRGKREMDDVLGNAKFNANQKYGNYGITPLMKLTVQTQVTRVYISPSNFEPLPSPPPLPAFVNASRVRAFVIFSDIYGRVESVSHGKLVTGFRIMTSGVLLTFLRVPSPRLWLDHVQVVCPAICFQSRFPPTHFYPLAARNEQFENR